MYIEIPAPFHPQNFHLGTTAGTMALLRISAALALLVAVCHGAKEDERDCEGAQSPLPLVR